MTQRKQWVIKVPENPICAFLPSKESFMTCGLRKCQWSSGMLRCSAALVPHTLSGPPAWGRPVRTLYFSWKAQLCADQKRDGTWVGSHQRNNMCARHRSWLRGPKPQKARNYRCLSLSITQSRNTGTFQSTAPIRSSLCNNVVRPLPSSRRPPEITWLTPWRPQGDSEDLVHATRLLVLHMCRENVYVCCCIRRHGRQCSNEGGKHLLIQ